MLANQIRPTTLSAAIVFRYIRFWLKKHRVLPFLAIALFFSCVEPLLFFIRFSRKTTEKQEIVLEIEIK